MKAFVVETSYTVYVCTAACALMLNHICSENLAVHGLFVENLAVYAHVCMYIQVV